MKKLKVWRTAEVFGAKVPVFRPGDLEEVNGFFDPNTKVIAIDSSLKGEELERTVMHEVLHALLDRLYIDSQLDEKLVEVIIENICGVVFDNFKVKWK